ncbi:MAG: hypothetical protein KDD45_16690 [Bdellovibrionales bacterium]|nr:hypothetical protein [Bdellovibrionales bacterium]
MNFKKESSDSEVSIGINEFKKRSDIHWARKIWHISGVLLIFILFKLLPLTFSKYLIVLAAVLFVSIDIIRKKNENINAFFVQCFKPIMRQHEIDKIAGTTYLFIGVSILILFFKPMVISLALLFLAVADPFASYFGIRYGKDKIYGHKTVQGFLAAFVICTAITIAFLIVNDFAWDRVILLGVLSGLLGALAELIPVAKLDDNLTIPVACGLGLTALFYLFGVL